MQQDLKTLRDKINNCIDPDEEKLLQEQWDEIHQQLEDERNNDDDNFSEFVK